MRSRRVIHTVSCHAEGEVGDVIVGGVAPPPGDTLWEQSRWIANDGHLRDLMLNEPRGGVFRHVNLIVPAKHPQAAFGFIIMEPVHTPPMSGSNSIAVATVLVETGMVAMVEPETRFTLEAPGGLVEVVAQCADGRVTGVAIRNMASFAGVRDAALTVPGLGDLTVDTAFGGDTFVVVDAEAIGIALTPGHALKLAELGVRIAAAATEQLGFEHPHRSDWRHISFCLFATPPEHRGRELYTTHAVAIAPGKIDRSPTGTGVSARLALLEARGALTDVDRLVAHSIIGSRFEGRIVEHTTVAGRAAVVPEIAGRAWITGFHQHLVDPMDPWPTGYRLPDTWPGG